MDYNKLVEFRAFQKLTGCNTYDEFQKLLIKERPDNSWFRHHGRGGKKGPAPCSVKRNCY